MFMFCLCRTKFSLYQYSHRYYIYRPVRGRREDNVSCRVCLSVCSLGKGSLSHDALGQGGRSPLCPGRARWEGLNRKNWPRRTAQSLALTPHSQGGDPQPLAKVKEGTSLSGRIAGCQAFLFFLFFSLNSYFSYFLLFFSLNSYFSYFFQILRLSLGVGM